MRRKEREITKKTDLEEIIDKALVCRLAMSRGDQPYVVPLCFGYRDNTLYFHCAREGMKQDILKENNKVCFEMETDCELVRGKSACEWGMKGRSIVGFGTASLVEEPSLKRKALDVVMEHYDAKRPFDYSEKALEKIVIIRVEILRMTGKKLP